MRNKPGKLAMSQCGLVLLNLGTPDSPAVGDVRTYLREFLSDPRVVDISALRRWALLNLIILPFRPKQSAAAYRKVWTDRGSPLLFHGQDLIAKLKVRLPDDVTIRLAMRYQNPSVRDVLAEFRHEGIDRLIVLPLFPQYSSAAWGSAVEAVYVEANRLWNVPAIQVVPPFFDHPAFIDSFASVTEPVLADLDPDMILMSFHGLPERHVRKSDESSDQRHCLRADNCCDKIVKANRNCYRAQCFATARALASALNLSPDQYEVAFQSRLGRSTWIRPYTDIRVRELAQAGVKRLAVLSPAFVADCLETLEEIAIRASEDFQAHGGERLELVPSLNSEDRWADGIITILADAGVPIDLPQAMSAAAPA